MENHQISRRSLLLKGGGTVSAGLTALQMAGPASVFGNADDEVIPWLDQPRLPHFHPRQLAISWFGKISIPGSRLPPISFTLPTMESRTILTPQRGAWKLRV